MPVDGSVEAAGGSLQFLRSGDINGTEAFVYCSFGSAGIDSDDWCPVASRSSTVGDGYEIRWEQVGTLFPVASANWAESTYASLDSTKSVNAPTVFGSYYEPEMESIDINIKIRKVGAGSPDVDQTITLRSTVTS